MYRVDSVITKLRSLQTNTELLFDCGSTETRVWHKGTLLFQEPTCVAVHRETGAVVAYGTTAVSLLGKVSTKFEVSFPIQAGEVASITLFHAFLEAVLQKITAKTVVTQLLGMSAAIVVPTEQSPVQEAVLRSIFRKVGIRTLRLVPLTTALLWSLGGQGKHESFCVFSFGGQRSEFAIYALEERVAAMTCKWGGVLFTERIQDQIRDQYACVVSWHVAEKVKREVASLLFFSKQTSRRQKSNKIAVRGKDVITQAGKTVIVSTDDFTEIFSDLVEEIVDRMQYFFSVVPADLVAASLEEGIYITGGVSAMLGLAELIEATFTTPVHISKTPQLDSGKGLQQYSSFYAKNSTS